ncbi:hypothetical protein LzC2_39650 [Planctomycetes bacterium LzC2]|uniref:Fe/B12 periplasmic-binding domain-containing protein n=1 Tax=Alienimonas chondri TaxID=2681879 RepID=A0ABX1VJ26_9PLAN|nr:hypothetical protein [Alienimonas chondri]
MQADHPRRNAEHLAAASLRERFDRSVAAGRVATEGAEPVVPRVWGIGVGANLAKEVGGKVRTAFDGVDVAEAVQQQPDLIVLPRSTGRSFDYDVAGPEWLAAGFRVLTPPDDPAERPVWEKLVVLVPEDAALGRPAATDDDSIDGKPIDREPAEIGPQSTASSNVDRYAAETGAAAAPDSSARR